ncbi:MAG: glycoside hydrolase family 28 protein [Bryobacteraceae bacterium]
MRTSTAVLLLSTLAAASLWAQDSRRVSEPRIAKPCAVLDAQLVSRGTTLAEADEARPDTRRIQAALDGCTPGRAVELRKAGERDAFLSGPLQLRRGVTLVVGRGATLFASRNPRDYDSRPGVCGTITEEGGPLLNFCKALLNGEGVDGAGVMGEGTIDGRGGYPMAGGNISWWDLAERARVGAASRSHEGYPGGNQNCPRLLSLSHCDNFTLYRIQLRNSPNFDLYYADGNGLTVWGIIINAPVTARNTDGIAPANSRNITITHCYINTGDDHISVKAPAGAPTSNMTIAHNHFYGGHGMSIGSNTDGGASAIRVSDLSIDGADNGLRIKSNNTLGGAVHDIEYDGVCMRKTKNPIVMDSNYSANFNKTSDKFPHFTDIRLKNVRVLDAGKITLDGYDAAHRLGIQFDNVVLDEPAKTVVNAVHADVILGPGPVNFRPHGEDVTVSGTAGNGAPYSCEGKFVPFPVPIATKP